MKGNEFISTYLLLKNKIVIADLKNIPVIICIPEV